MTSGRRQARLLVVCALAVGCGTSSPSSPSASATSPRRVVVLGDSLAVSPSVAQAFPAQLQTMIERERLPWTVTNAGVSGDTTAGGVRRVQSVLAADVGVLMLELGANDGLAGINPAVVERNLSTIVEAARVRNIEVLLCGMETIPTRGLDYLLDFHQIF